MSIRHRRIKTFMSLGVVCLLVCFSTNALGKDPKYPTKQIEFIITYGAGGTTDLSCRALCEAASKHLPQPVIPINKPAASGITGTALIRNAKPDGYTIGVFTQSAAFIIPFVQEVPYDPLRDFTPIMHFGEFLYPVMVRADKPWKTWKELVEWARKNPGDIKVGITGSKSTQMLGIALYRIELKENIKFTYVPFKSSLETLTGLLGGHIDLFGASMDASSKDYINMGKLRILSFLSKSKLSGFEKIASTEELYGISVSNLKAVIGPKGLSPSVRKTLEEAFTKAIKEPSLLSAFKKMDTAVVYMPGEELRKYIEKNYKEHQELINRLKAEDIKKQ